MITPDHGERRFALIGYLRVLGLPLTGTAQNWKPRSLCPARFPFSRDYPEVRFRSLQATHKRTKPIKIPITSVIVVSASLTSASQLAHTGELSSPPAKVTSPAPIVIFCIDHSGHEKTRRSISLAGCFQISRLYKYMGNLFGLKSQSVLLWHSSEDYLMVTVSLIPNPYQHFRSACN